MKSLERFFIAGAGNVGVGFAWALQDTGHTLTGIWNRSPERLDNDLLPQGVPQFSGHHAQGLSKAMQAAQVIIIAVADSAIESTSLALLAGGEFSPDTLVVHTSGCMPAEALAGARGTIRGGLHPLAALPDVKTARQRLRSTTYALDGNDHAQQALGALVEKLGGKSFAIRPHERARYHAAAVMASNLVVSLLQLATKEAALAGLDDPAPLLELAMGALQSSREKGVLHALTGPILRGDAQTIEKHLQVLDEDSQESYVALSKCALNMARLRGLSAHGVWELEQLLERFSEKA